MDCKGILTPKLRTWGQFFIVENRNLRFFCFSKPFVNIYENRVKFTRTSEVIVYLSIYLSICLSVCTRISIYLFIFSPPKNGREYKKYFFNFLSTPKTVNFFLLFSLPKNGSENKKFFIFSPKTTVVNIYIYIYIYIFNIFPPLKMVEKIEVFFFISLPPPPPPPPKKKNGYENKCSFTLGPSQTSQKSLSNPGIFCKHMTNVRFYIFHLNFLSAMDQVWKSIYFHNLFFFGGGGEREIKYNTSIFTTVLRGGKILNIYIYIYIHDCCFWERK